jgi:hypothetical protein
MTTNPARRFLDRITGRRATPPAPPTGWVCATCGQTHDDLPALAFDAPLAWEIASEQERAADFELTSDTCIWKDEHYFVHCRLKIPFTDRDGALNFGVWSSLGRENFFRYLATFDDADAADLPPMFGWFSNSLPGYPETLNLKCTVHAQPGGLRPLIELEATDHPLSVQHHQGVSFGEAVAYVHAHLAL